MDSDEDLSRHPKNSNKERQSKIVTLFCSKYPHKRSQLGIV